MLTPIVCFSCGCSLGDLAPIYHAVRRGRVEARRKAEMQKTARPAGAGGGAAAAGAAAGPAAAAVDPTLSENFMGDVLEALRITHCCRTRLITAMILSEHY